MTTTDVHRDIQDPHLQGVAVLRLALITAALHRDVMSIPTYPVAVIAAIADRMKEDDVAHPPSGDLSLGHGQLHLPHRTTRKMATRNVDRPGTVDTRQVDPPPLCVEGIVGTEDQEVQGAVTELDPLHLQIPLTHDLPEDLKRGAMLQSPHVVVPRHLGVDAPLHLYPDHVLLL